MRRFYAWSPVFHRAAAAAAIRHAVPGMVDADDLYQEFAIRFLEVQEHYEVANVRHLMGLCRTAWWRRARDLARDVGRRVGVSIDSLDEEPSAPAESLGLEVFGLAGVEVQRSVRMGILGAAHPWHVDTVAEFLQHGVG